MIDAYPLQWPIHWPRSSFQKRSAFGNFSFERVRRGVLGELKLLGATDIVISTNLMLRRDGFPYSGQRQPEDTGVAIYFKLNGEDQCIPCDKWLKVEDNMRAVEKTIEALRGLDRWGAKEMVDAAFRGFKALPEHASPSTVRSPYEILEVPQSATPEEINSSYRRLVRIKHPDMGGSEEDFIELNKAYESIMR